MFTLMNGIKCNIMCDNTEKRINKKKREKNNKFKKIIITKINFKKIIITKINFKKIIITMIN